ncbi:MAG: S24 family peptidase [Sphingomonas sp.]
MSDPRAALDALVTDSGVGYAALSRMLRRNEAYLQQFVKRGSPRRLAERDRALLAAFFRVDEAVLGGPPRRVGPPAIRRLDLAASAGPGALSDDDPVADMLVVDPAVLASLGIDRTRASFLPARGDSMEPTICDGDLMLIDERASRKSGLFVVRLDGALIVKRLVWAGKSAVTVVSDNPAYPPFSVPVSAIDVVGRVVWLSRALR